MAVSCGDKPVFVRTDVLMGNDRLRAAGRIHSFNGYVTAGSDAKHGRSLGKDQQKDNNRGKPVAAESSHRIPKAARKSIFLSIRPHGPAIIAKAIDPINEKSHVRPACY